MKRIKLFVATCAALLAIGGQSISTLAYSPETEDYTNPEGEWIVDNFHGKDNHVVFYMLADSSDRNVQNIRSSYHFACVNGEFPDGWDSSYVAFVFNFSPENKRVIQTTDVGDIWVWEFGLEDGDYMFSTGTQDGFDNYVLDSTLKLPVAQEGFKLKEYVQEVTSVGGGETIRLYAIKGSKEYAKANAEFFSEWAEKNESDYINLQKDIAGDSGETETIVVDEPTITTEEIQSTESLPVVDATETEDDTEEALPEVESEPAVEEKSGSGVIKIVGTLFAVAILGLLVKFSKRS